MSKFSQATILIKISNFLICFCSFDYMMMMIMIVLIIIAVVLATAATTITTTTNNNNNNDNNNNAYILSIVSIVGEQWNHAVKPFLKLDIPYIQTEGLFCWCIGFCFS